MKPLRRRPEFSFVLGYPPDPEGDMARTFEFIRRIKHDQPGDRDHALHLYAGAAGRQRCTRKRSGSASRFPRRSRNGRRTSGEQLIDAPRRRHPVD